MSLFTHTAYLKRAGEPGGYDDWGNPIPGEPTRDATPAWWEPRESTEAADASQQVVSGYWLYLPEDTDLTAYDAVELAGVDYEVQGEPGRQPGGFIVEGYVKAAVRRVAG